MISQWSHATIGWGIAKILSYRSSLRWCCHHPILAQQQNQIPILHEFALDIFCSPITKTSIEGFFSDLPFFLSKFRYNFDSEMIETIIMLRRNHIYMGMKVTVHDIEWRKSRRNCVKWNVKKATKMPKIKEKYTEVCIIYLLLFYDFFSLADRRPARPDSTKIFRP